MDIAFDNGIERISLSQYEPVVIRDSSPSDDGSYLIDLQTSNQKLIDLLEELDKNNPRKFIITTSTNTDELFGELKVMNKGKDMSDTITKYSLSILRIS